jgi:hypothetical protein
MVLLMGIHKEPNETGKVFPDAEHTQTGKIHERVLAKNHSFRVQNSPIVAGQTNA